MIAPHATRDPILVIRDLHKHFAREGLLRRGTLLRAVDGVDLTVHAGEVVALVGESGSGKTTLARCALGLERPTAGQVLFDDIDVSRARGDALRRFRRGVQPVFQDPYASLDPRWTVMRSVREALDAQRIGRRADRDRRVRELLELVGLPGRFGDRRPDELSGGQRQRVCIAAALASSPRLLIADEPVTALDVSVQAQVLNLLYEIQRDLGLAILVVAHDLAVVAHMADSVAVMYLGRIVERGAKDAIFARPRHPYTQALLAASPRPDPERKPAAGLVRGELIAAASPSEGCRFRPRCRHAIDICASRDPALVPVSLGQLAACHVLPEEPTEGGADDEQPAVRAAKTAQ